MTKFLSLTINGAVTGAVFAVMASGLVLTYQTSGIFNFAHGAIAFVVAFLFFELHQPTSNGGLGWPIIPSAIVSVVVFAPLFGMLLDKVLLRRLAQAPVYARIVGTIGLLVALPNLALWIVERCNALFDAGLPTIEQVFGPPGLGPAPKKTWHLMKGVAIDSNQLAIFAAAALAAVLLWFVLRRTRIGLEMRAGVDRNDLALIRGVNTRRTSMVAWSLSFLLAGLGGVLIAPIFQLTDLTYTLVVLGSIAAVVFARLRSIPLAFVGGLLLGVVGNLLVGYVPGIELGGWKPFNFLNNITGFNTAIPYIITFVLLFFLGRVRGRLAGSASDERPPSDHRDGLPTWRRLLPWALFLVVFVAITVTRDEFWSGKIATGLALGIIFLSFVVVTGLGGMVSLAQATFVTAGGFTAGWLVNHQFSSTTPLLMNNGHTTFVFAALAGALVAAAAGVIVALPVRKLGALEGALATLAVAFIADGLIFQLNSISNGSNGYAVTPPTVGPYDLNLGFATIRRVGDFTKPHQMAILLLVLFGLLTLMIRNLQRSATGRGVLAVRSSEVAARTSGMSEVRAKLVVFAVSAGIAGFGGVMFAAAQSPGTITSRSAPPIIGLIWLAVAVLWGIRRPGGALLAGLFLALFADVLKWAVDHVASGNDTLTKLLVSQGGYFVPILIGLGAIVLSLEPSGMLAITGRQTRGLLDRLLGSRRAAPPSEPAELGPPPQPVIHLAEVAVTEHAAASEDGAAATAATVEPDPPLELRKLRAGYGEVEVLRGVDLVVPQAQVVALLGANGAGKTTLCAVAAGLLPPTGGTLRRHGVDVTHWAAYRRANGGMLLAPEARGVFPSLTVEENLSLRLRSVEERRRAYERFPILGQRRKQEAGLLSGGEQQMLALVPALVDPPDVFIADEPSHGLAPLMVEEVFRALAELRDLGTALLLVEEKARDVLELADIVAFMELGRVTWTGPRSEVDAERLTTAYLGVVSS